MPVPLVAVTVIIPSLQTPVVGAVFIVDKANAGGKMPLSLTQVAIVSKLATTFVLIFVPLITNSSKLVPRPTKAMLSKLQLAF